MKLPVEEGLGLGLGFEVRSKAKMSLDGALGRTKGDEMSPQLPHQDATRAEPVTWKMVRPELAMGPLAVGSPGPEEESGEQTEIGRWSWQQESESRLGGRVGRPVPVGGTLAPGPSSALS